MTLKKKLPFIVGEILMGFVALFIAYIHQIPLIALVAILAFALAYFIYQD